MKKIRIAKRLLVMACVALCGVFLNCGDAFAHDIYYNGNIPVTLRWNFISSNGIIQIKINGNNLDSKDSKHYSTIKSEWNKHSKISVVETSFANSNLDLAYLPEDEWDKRFYGYPRSLETLGYCESITTDNVEIKNKTTAQNSSGRIRYANLIYTPYYREIRDDNHRRLVMMHEVGHALGIGHSNGDFRPSQATSIMRKATDGDYYSLQQHDIDDVNNLYLGVK